jgi:hypothetical protein
MVLTLAHYYRDAFPLYDCTITSKQEFLPTIIQNHALMRIPTISITKQEAGKHNAGA